MRRPEQARRNRVIIAAIARRLDPVTAIQFQLFGPKGYLHTRIRLPEHYVSDLPTLLEGAQATDLATLLDLQGVAVRSGHHCAHPLMQFYGVPATLRASLAFYNTREEVDIFIAALLKVRKLLL